MTHWLPSSLRVARCTSPNAPAPRRFTKESEADGARWHSRLPLGTIVFDWRAEGVMFGLDTYSHRGLHRAPPCY